MLKAAIERRCRDRNGQRQSSRILGRNEIPLVTWCLDRAFAALPIA